MVGGLANENKEVSCKSSMTLDLYALTSKASSGLEGPIYTYVCARIS